jgi:hypothetical protein
MMQISRMALPGDEPPAVTPARSGTPMQKKPARYDLGAFKMG